MAVGAVVSLCVCVPLRGVCMQGVSFTVRDIQSRADLPVACGHVGFEIAAHATAFVHPPTILTLFN